MRIARPPLGAGIAAAILGVAAATAVLFGLRRLAPVASLGVVYVLVVLVVSTYWGVVLGIATALLSGLAFNFFHIPPTGRFAIASSENWVGLLTFLAVAAAASAVADLARERALEAQERRQEADLAADAARTLLGGTGLESGLAQTAHEIAVALELPSAQLVLGDDADRPASDDRRTALPLQRDGVTIAMLVLPAGRPAAGGPGAPARADRPGAGGVPAAATTSVEHRSSAAMSSYPRSSMTRRRTASRCDLVSHVSTIATHPGSAEICA